MCVLSIKVPIRKKPVIFLNNLRMLGYNDLLSRPSIESNTIWEPIIKKGS